MRVQSLRWEDPLVREMQLTSLLLPGESHGQRSPVSYSPWGRKEWDTTEQVFCCCSVTKSCLTLCTPMNCSTSGFPVLHYLLEFAQTHVHWVSDTILPSHSLSPFSPPALSLSQYQGLFQWAGSLHQVAKVLELQLHHQPFQWICSIDFL